MLQVEVFQGRRALYQGTANEVILPGEEGELSVWAWHAPMLCRLGPGEVLVDARRYPMAGGLACVWRNHLLIMGRV